jgi:hypothetical protein
MDSCKASFWTQTEFDYRLASHRLRLPCCVPGPMLCAVRKPTRIASSGCSRRSGSHREAERQKIGDVCFGRPLRQLGEHMQEICIRFDVARPAREHQAVDHGARLRTGDRVCRLSPCAEGSDVALNHVMPTPRLCRVMNPRIQRSGESLSRVARVVGIIREPPGRRATDLEVCSVSARCHSPSRARARVP